MLRHLVRLVALLMTLPAVPTVCGSHCGPEDTVNTASCEHRTPAPTSAASVAILSQGSGTCSMAVASTPASAEVGQRMTAPDAGTVDGADVFVASVDARTASRWLTPDRHLPSNPGGGFAVLRI
jgi:hypothetical protein